MWPIDPSKRGAWQRIVTSARMLSNAPQHPGLVLQAKAGTTFFSTGWRIEPGAVPHDCLSLPADREDP